jgi:hypothetical protein
MLLSQSFADMNSNNNNQFELLDILNVLSFVIGVLNYQENLTQGDKQDLMKDFDSKTKLVLDEIHAHLEKQDKILEALYDKN